jgi:hypothetical protein
MSKGDTRGVEHTSSGQNQDKQGSNPTVYSLIHELHSTITKSIDTSLSWDQLNSPPVNYTLVRPIVENLCPPISNDFKSAGPGVGERERFLDVPMTTSMMGDGGEMASDGIERKGKNGLGMILYALMANR